eukprot:CAMPEP_0202442714 /NCGR_PEP_ID=MMETSP1360-20130828/2091_1 /ASSEMBLY_ACC=CAM_ASM_000848 /TAXON_ID=515479 /ORGANISM="Licmophora paradoxa, Strain CCMP2313" /LENGTH=176 /DNA_ID=CAMNT_0049058153 /DNA_START=162 /DNA_END=692 /DNA_ORIENTATION=+
MDLLEDDEPTSRRQLIDFWSLLFLLHHNPCDHPQPKIGPLSHRSKWCEKCSCDDEDSDSDSGSDSDGYDSYYTTDFSTGVQGSSNTDSSQTDYTARSSSTMSFIMLLVAAMAATTALAAVVIGQRRETKEKHQLEGSVARRITLFQTFADSALCGSDRPERTVEMTNSKDDYNRMA